MSLHEHDFGDVLSEVNRNQQRTLWVLLLTLFAMIIEIVFGLISGSMSLLADGLHMSSHLAAMAITFFAYSMAKSSTLDLPFGGGKFIPLGGYTSGLFLFVIALVTLWTSCQRLLEPITVNFGQAIKVAFFGLAVNLISIAILRPSEIHHESTHGHDHNIRGAYLHVLADCLTSLLAIVALASGLWAGLNWLDPAMGVVGGFVILWWSLGLVKESGLELVDAQAKHLDTKTIRQEFDKDGACVEKFRAWKIAPHTYASEIVIQTPILRGSEHYRNVLKGKYKLAHVIVEENLTTKEA